MSTQFVLNGAVSGATDGPRLVGTTCTSCGTWSFPRTFTCINPKCTDKHVEDAALARVGRLASWTTVHVAPPPPFVAANPFVPFVIVEVEFPEGLQIIGPLATGDDSSLEVGALMETVLDTYYTTAEGNVVMGWKFRSIGSESK